MNENIIGEAASFVKKIFMDDPGGHDHFHTMRVYKMAARIAEQEGADILTVSLAALLHDVDDIKLSPGTHKNKDRAAAFLREQGVSEEMTEAVCSIIKEVSFMGTDSVVPGTPEGRCVQDADRLDALGAVGIARTFAYGGSHGRAIHDPDIEPAHGMNGEEYRSHVSTSVNHFYEKLFLLRGMMNTDTGRRLAAQREAYMKDYISEFLDEWEGIR